MASYDWYALTDAGGNPDGNEDAFVVDADHGVFVVADGVGGGRGGAQASRLAAETFAGLVVSAPAGQRLDDALLRDAVTRVHEAVVRAGEVDDALRGLASTLSAVVIEGDRAKLVHVGDSRVYRCSGGRIEQLTRDHTLAAEVERQGGGGVAPRFQNMLARAIGAGERVVPDVTETSLREGDWLLLVTDGVTKALETSELLGLVGAAGSPEGVCSGILRAALARGPADNLTVAAVEVSA